MSTYSVIQFSHSTAYSATFIPPFPYIFAIMKEKKVNHKHIIDKFKFAIFYVFIYCYCYCDEYSFERIEMITNKTDVNS